MKYLITEDQLEKVKEKILKIPFDVFDDWDLLQKYLSRRGNPPYILIGDLVLNGRKDIESLGSLIEVKGDLNLYKTTIKTLGNLTSVGGDLSFGDTPIESLGNLTSVGGNLNMFDTPIESLGNLTSVGGSFDLSGTPIESLGNLTSVGGTLYLENTPISEKYTKAEIIYMVQVDGNLYL